jgi:hypothetical protein
MLDQRRCHPRASKVSPTRPMTTRQQSEAAAYRLEDVVREQRHNQHTQDGQMR